MSNTSLKRGDPVKAGRDGSFVGHILGRGSARDGYENYQSDEDSNIPVWAVEDRTIGEVRFFRADFVVFNG